MKPSSLYSAWLGAALAVAAVMVPLPSLAIVSSTATMSNLHFTLVDLDTTDGTTPSLVFSSAGRSSLSQTLDGGTAVLTYGSSGFAPISNSISNGSASVSASVSGGNPYALEASGQASAAGHGYRVYGYAPDVNKGFTLSPHTRLTVKADASLTASMGAGDSGFAAAYMTLAIYDPLNPPPGSPYTVQDAAFASLTGGSASTSRALQIVFENLGSTPIEHNFYAYVQADGALTAVSAVPEPAALAMMLAGWGALAARARRHRRR
jgi:hypothetical protein